MTRGKKGVFRKLARATKKMGFKRTERQRKSDRRFSTGFKHAGRRWKKGFGAIGKKKYWNKMGKNFGA